MFIKALKADCFKNLEKVMIEPHEKYNLITGHNAQGKTNLLECIWLMTGCKSFRGSKDRDCIGIDKEIMDIGMSFDDGRRIQTVSYKLARSNIKARDIKLNGVPLKGTNGLFNNFKAVLFTPDDIDLVKGTPEKRRSFIDLCCCQLNPHCMDVVKKYDLVLCQRNNLLKLISAGKQKREYLDVWNQQASVMGTLLSQGRENYIKKLSVTCSELYSTITGGKEKLTIEYNSNVFGNKITDLNDGNDAVAMYYSKLHDNTEDDIRLGYTISGAHRDDISIKINGLNIRDFGSQGQKKTTALVLKLGQAEIYYKNKSEAPVILLDDVMGELDEDRQKLVFDIVKDMQVFISSCNENAVAALSEGYVFEVSDGRVVKQQQKR